MTEAIKNRYGSVVLPDVENGDPDDDPDAGDLPRINPESGYGIVTDVYLKHEIRNYVEILKGDKPGYKIYMQESVPLNRSDNTAYVELKIDEEGIKELKRKDPQVDQRIRDFMCRDLFDVRTFGAVMTTFVKAALNYGRVRGPAQLGSVRNIDPIVSQEVTIIRVTIIAEKDTENRSTEVGGKDIVPYVLYRVGGYISVSLTRKSTGFSEEDLEPLQDAIISTFEIDHSAAGGKVVVRRLIVFKHSKELGSCPTHKLFDAAEAKGNEDVEYPRKYGDYTVAVYRDQIPETIEVSEKI